MRQNVSVRKIEHLIGNVLIGVLAVSMSLLCFALSFETIGAIPYINGFNWFYIIVTFPSSFLSGLILFYLFLACVKNIVYSRTITVGIFGDRDAYSGKYFLIIKLFWIVVCLYLLIDAINTSVKPYSNEVTLLVQFYPAMGVLSFPLGAVAVVFYRLFGFLVRCDLWVKVVSVWGVFVVSGYIQWFIILPQLIEKYKERKKVD